MLDCIFIGLVIMSAVASNGMVLLFAYCCGGFAAAAVSFVALAFLWLIVTSLCKAAAKADSYMGI